MGQIDFHSYGTDTVTCAFCMYLCWHIPNIEFTLLIASFYHVMQVLHARTHFLNVLLGIFGAGMSYQLLSPHRHSLNHNNTWPSIHNPSLASSSTASTLYSPYTTNSALSSPNSTTQYPYTPSQPSQPTLHHYLWSNHENEPIFPTSGSSVTLTELPVVLDGAQTSRKHKTPPIIYHVTNRNAWLHTDQEIVDMWWSMYWAKFNVLT